MRVGLSERIRFQDAEWLAVPDAPGVYVIHDLDEVVYVGMAGRNGRGSLRSRLRDHASGQIVNMFTQYLFLARIQFLVEDRISHPRAAKAACQKYIRKRCSFQYLESSGADKARDLERELKSKLKPVLNT